MKTAEEILKEIYDFKTLNGAYDDFKTLHPLKHSAIIAAMEEYLQQSYASQPSVMSAEEIENNLMRYGSDEPDEYRAWHLGIIDGLSAGQKLNVMSAEQVEELGYYYPLFKFFSDEHGLSLLDSQLQDVIHECKKFIEPASPSVKAEGWVSVEDGLPEPLETVWLSNGKGFTSLGCRTELVDVGDDTYNWCWAQSNGIIYEEKGKIVSECEDDDLDVKFWQPLPAPPKQQL